MQKVKILCCLFLHMYGDVCFQQMMNGYVDVVIGKTGSSLGGCFGMVVVDCFCDACG